PAAFQQLLEPFDRLFDTFIRTQFHLQRHSSSFLAGLRLGRNMVLCYFSVSSRLSCTRTPG
ncbi:MAG: hypothetical protein NZ914_07285, partial [Gemmatales bacterium]|nr:hypothetical protein [Gemmatales bacterium]